MRPVEPEPLSWADAETVSFGDRLAGSRTFMLLFRDGMALIEETAGYLDGPGRAESRDLDRGPALTYATESMRLTTRLMQLASWLLLQRAVNEGELTKEQARADKVKIKIAALEDESAWSHDVLPEALLDLIARSRRLQGRILHLDQLIYGEEPRTADNPVSRDLDRLRAAFPEAI